MKEKITPEWYFFIYAHPAIGECVSLTDDEKEELENMIHSNKAPSKNKLESLVPNAFKRMKEKIGEDYWTIENIKKYWWIFHNEIIDKGELGYENASMQHKETCKVKFWKVIEINKDIVTIKNERQDKILKARNYRNLPLIKDDYVTTHKMHIVEKITQEDYQKYS